jgi:hypothetical protein
MKFIKNKIEVVYYCNNKKGSRYEFKPENLEPYYDIANNGECIFYIKIHDMLMPVHENDITVTYNEILKRVHCGVTT